MLGQDQIGLAATRIVTLKRIRAVQQDHHVGVLLDRARLAEVGEHWLLIGALLRPAVQLTHRHHRYLKLLRQKLELTGEFGHLLLA